MGWVLESWEYGFDCFLFFLFEKHIGVESSARGGGEERRREESPVRP